MSETTLPDLLSLDTAVRAFDVSRWHLECAVERGELTATVAQIGVRRMVLLNRADVARWKEGRA